MPEFKERPKGGKPKTRPTIAAPPRQAARLMKEKYRQQLDQRPEGTDTEATAYASDKVEGAGRRAVDEAVAHRPRRQQSKNPLKERQSTEGKTDPAKGEKPKAEPQKPKQRPADRPKERLATSPKTREQTHQRATSTPRKRTNPILKERSDRAAQPPSPAPSQAVPRPEDKKALLENSRQPQALRRELPQEAPEVAYTPPGHSLTPGGTPSANGTPKGGSAAKAAPRRTGAFKERPKSAIKTRSTIPAPKSKAPTMKARPTVTRATKRAARQTVQQQMTQRMVAQAQRAAKATMTAAKKMAEATVRAVAALVSGLVGLLGGGVLLALLLLVAIVAAVASSPFGIFFAGGGDSGGGSTQPTVSVAEAVAQVNTDYNARLESLQAGAYDSIDVTGAAPEWPDVLAAFASRYAAADDGVDVATLDADRVEKLKDTFWDMTEITYTVEPIDHPDSDPDDDTDDSWTEYILHITITSKTAEDMKGVYSLNDFQKDAMNELLSDRAALASLAGSLDITNTEVLTVRNDLPIDLSPDRRKAVETALQLVGKVNYFWGGKSYVLGWDSRWGQLAKVTAADSTTTGTFRPYGLDCSGFIDWTLRNAGLPSDGHWYIGTNLTEVTQAEALPGDMALYPDASHVGMVVGRDSTGKLLICHCSSGANNVVITEYAASGFTVLGRPSIYSP